MLTRVAPHTGQSDHDSQRTANSNRLDSKRGTFPESDHATVCAYRMIDAAGDAVKKPLRLMRRVSHPLGSRPLTGELRQGARKRDRKRGGAAKPACDGHLGSE